MEHKILFLNISTMLCRINMLDGGLRSPSAFLVAIVVKLSRVGD